MMKDINSELNQEAILSTLYLSELMKIYMTTPHMLRNEGVRKGKYGGVCVPDKILRHDEEET